MAPTFSIINNASRLGFRGAIRIDSPPRRDADRLGGFSHTGILQKGCSSATRKVPPERSMRCPWPRRVTKAPGRTGVGKDGSVEPAPLFGQGVSEAPAGAPVNTAGRRAARAFDGGSSGKGPQGRAPAGAPSHPSGPSAIVKPDSVSDGPGYSALSGIGLVAAIVLVGGLLRPGCCAACNARGRA